jgi:hypothetical protein
VPTEKHFDTPVDPQKANYDHLLTVNYFFLTRVAWICLDTDPSMTTSISRDWPAANVYVEAAT